MDARYVLMFLDMMAFAQATGFPRYDDLQPHNQGVSMPPFNFMANRVYQHFILPPLIEIRRQP